MPSTYTLISSNVLSTSAASVTFSAIPSTYTDLVLRASVRGDGVSAAYGFNVTFNGDVSSTLYSQTVVRGNGAAASSTSTSAYPFISNPNAADGAGATASTFANLELYLASYTASASKALSSFSAQETNATTAYVSANAGLYRSNTAISTILLELSGGNFVSGSSFYLYGIKNS